MTSDELKAAAERLLSHQMFRKDCKHLWNAHRQCQWCHSMQRDVDIADVAEGYLANETRLADLERLRQAAVRVGQAMLDAGPADDNGPTPEVEEEYYKAMDELKFLAVELAKLTPATPTT